MKIHILDCLVTDKPNIVFEHVRFEVMSVDDSEFDDLLEVV